VNTGLRLIIYIPMSKQILNEKIKRNLNIDKNGHAHRLIIDVPMSEADN